MRTVRARRIETWCRCVCAWGSWTRGGMRGRDGGYVRVWMGGVVEVVFGCVDRRRERDACAGDVVSAKRPCFPDGISAGPGIWGCRGGLVAFLIDMRNNLLMVIGDESTSHKPRHLRHCYRTS